VSDPTNSQKKISWAVVGGGLLGMTIAHRLAVAGHKVHLFESSPSLGGLASAWQIGDVVWDRHYHVTLLSDLATRSLVAELGLIDELRWAETKTGFYTSNGLVSMSNSVEFLKFPSLGMLDKLRLGMTIFYASRVKHWQRLEEISVEDWLRRWSGNNTFESVWLPLLRAKLGENYKNTAASFIWATIARMYAARRTGMKKEMFGYVQGGYARVLDHFSSTLSAEGVAICCQTPIPRISSAAEGKLTIHLQCGDRKVFDKVVVTAPATVAAGICEGLLPAEKARLRGIKYQGIICASLLLKMPLAGFYVTNITDGKAPFTAVIEMTALVDPKYFGGKSLIYLPKYIDPDDSFLALGDEEIEHRFLEALERMYPNFRREDVLAFRLSRVKHVFPLPCINYSKSVPDTTTSVPGLFLANSAQILNGTLNVNETIQLANRTADNLLRQAALGMSQGEDSHLETASKAGVA
jgi:protoporphyrinogen oxidase